MDDLITDRAALIREVRKPGKVYVTMLVRDDIKRIAVEKADFLAFLQEQPETDCSVMGSRQDGVLIIDANCSS